MRIRFVVLMPVLSVLILACSTVMKYIKSEKTNSPRSLDSTLDPLPPVWGGANQPELWFQPPSRRRRQLEAMREADLRVVRIILGHRDESVWWEDPPYPYTFEDPIGFFHEKEFQMVDDLISECREFGIRLIVCFGVPSNYFARFGDWEFYASESARRAYLHRIRQCLLRIHSASGVMWKDIDDVIWAWEIANEPGLNLKGKNEHSPEETTNLMRSWLERCAATIAAIDPDTPISLGTAGYSRYYGINCGDDPVTLQDIPHADIYTLHFYGGDLRRWIQETKTVTDRLGKRLLVEEFGNQRKVGQEKLVETYRYVIDICREERVPWMFWRLGQHKDDDSWSVMADDPVWRELFLQPLAPGMPCPPQP